MITFHCLLLLSQYTPPDLVFPIGGQSNASGRGPLVDLPSPWPPANVASRIQMFGNDWVYKPATEPVDTSSGQIDGISIDSNAAVSFGVAFAARLAERVPNRIILVPCALAASRVVQWLPSSGLRRDTLYGSCLWRTLHAARKGILAGFLWYQGESEARIAGEAATYRQNTQDLFTRLREDVNDPRLPIVFVQIHPNQPTQVDVFWQQIRADQAALQGANQIMVEANGTQIDQLHLSTASQLSLGRRMADAYLSHIGAPP